MLERARRVAYLTDNAGEIVFDRLLIETIKQAASLEVVCVVKSVPVLNDATLAEAKLVGIDRLATVMENGINGPLPGTILARCSGDVRRLIEDADLIISKGGGNFDTLDEEIGLDDRLFSYSCASAFHTALILALSCTSYPLQADSRRALKDLTRIIAETRSCPSMTQRCPFGKEC